MGARYELLWHGSDGIERSLSVRDLVSVGRGERNDLLVPSHHVSWQHARFWAEDATLWVADAGSTNGTFVNDRKVEGNTRLEPGDKVRLGQVFVMHVRRAEGAAPARGVAMVVEDVHSGVRYPLVHAVVVGPDADATVRVPDADRVEIVREGDLIVRLQGGRRFPVVPGEAMSVGGLSLRVLVVGRQAPVPTVRPGWGPGEYHIDATLIGRTPAARVFDDHGGQLEVEGETRATLIYVLAQQVLRDREEGAPASDVGWVEDGEAVQRVWGRTAANDVSNRLSVVVYRLRSDLKKAGLEPVFLERERGRIRVRAAMVSLN